VFGAPSFEVISSERFTEGSSPWHSYSQINSVAWPSDAGVRLAIQELGEGQLTNDRLIERRRGSGSRERSERGS
jgi:hypothetical protein